MSRIYLMSLLFVCPGCGGLFESAAQMADFTRTVNAVTISATPEQAIAAVQAELPAQDLVAGAARKADGKIVIVGAPAAASGFEKALTSGLTALGSTDDYSDLPKGCTITIHPVGEKIGLRASCFEMVEEPTYGKKNARPTTRRQSWQDPYLLTRIIEHLEPATAQRLWDTEQTGHRLRRCAIGPSMLNFGCPPKRAKREKRADEAKITPPG